MDIICISESWLPPEIQSNFIEIPEFSVYCCDGARGGGVCIYISDQLKETVLSSELVGHYKLKIFG